MIKNRIESGKLLSEKMHFHDGNVLVLAIPRGGVIVANEIAKKLGCIIDVIISKKITPPDNPEYAIGAITADGAIYKGPNWDFYSGPGLEDEISKKSEEVRRRLQKYRGSSDYHIEGKKIILVDDGVATGSTVFAILSWLKQQKTEQIILAIPVIPEDTYEKLRPLVTEIFALEIPIEFSSVGQFYRNFEQVEDEEVIKILKNNSQLG